jgi:hypothetical protein
MDSLRAKRWENSLDWQTDALWEKRWEKSLD